MSLILKNIAIKDRETITLTEDEWKIVEDLVMVLEPFMVGIEYNCQFFPFTPETMDIMKIGIKKRIVLTDDNFFPPI